MAHRRSFPCFVKFASTCSFDAAHQESVRCRTLQGLSSDFEVSIRYRAREGSFKMRSTGALALCFLLAAVLFMSAMTEAVTAESKRVMLLHSFGTDFRPWSEYAKTIRDELNRQSPWPLDITEQSLVTARSSD